MKKFLSVLLSVCILLSLTTAVLADSTAPKNWLCDEKTTLKVITYDAVNNSYLPPSNDLPFWQWMEDYTNVKVDWEVHSNADYETIISTKLAAAELDTDVIVIKGLDKTNQAGKNGLLIDVAPYYDTLWSNIKAYTENENPALYQNIKNADGSIYGVCGMVEPQVGHVIYMYNTQWMDKLNLEIPKTLEEFDAVLTAMKQAGDINENGKDDELILTGSGISSLDIIGNSFGLEVYEDWDAFAADDQGVVYPEYTSEKMREYFRYLNKLYAQGLLDPSITNTSANEMSEKIAADKVGVFIYYSAFAITYGSLTSAGQATPMDCHYTLGVPLAGSDGEPYLMRREKGDGTVGAVSASSKNAELALKWLDVLIADPVVLKTRTFGFEGQDWEYNTQGEMDLIYPEDGSTWNIAKKGCGQITLPFIQTADQLMNSKKQYQWYMDQYAILTDEQNNYFISPSVPHIASFSDEEQEKIDMVKTDLVSYFKEMRAKFITGEANIDTDWDSFVKTLESMGLDAFTSVYQSVYDRTR